MLQLPSLLSPSPPSLLNIGEIFHACGPRANNHPVALGFVPATNDRRGVLDLLELDLIEPLLPLAEDNEEAASLYARTSSRPEPEIEELVVWIGGVR